MRLRWGIAASVALTLAALPAAPSRAADAPYIDWPGLLPPLGTPYTPNVEPDCADGADACIDRTIAEMYRRLNAVVPACGHDAVFALAYLRVTEDVRDANRSGYFDDPRWLNHEDAVFARMYFDAYDDYAAGRRKRVPAAWQMAFDTARERRMGALGNFLMSMNAHINRDFPYLLAGIGITRPDGVSRKSDHDRYNRHLLELYKPVIAEEAARFDPAADEYDLAGVDDLGVEAILQSWREGVWRNAERLLAARTPAQRKQVSDSIEQLAVGIGRMIIGMFGYGPGQTSAARDAWCAHRGGQVPSAGTPRLALARGLRIDRRGAVRLRASCPAGTSACRGSVELASRRAATPLSSTGYFLLPKQAASLKLMLARDTAARLRGRRTGVVVRLRRAGVQGASARPATLR